MCALCSKPFDIFLNGCIVPLIPSVCKGFEVDENPLAIHFLDFTLIPLPEAIFGVDGVTHLEVIPWFHVATEVSVLNIKK